jgi:2'-5' RNA ligase
VDLFGFEPPPPRLKRPPVRREGNDRLFFALFPDAEAAEGMLALGADFQTRQHLTGKLHLQDRLHLTLDHLGDFAGRPQDVVERASRAGSEVAAATAGFAVILDRVVSFGRGDRSRPLVLKDSGTGNPALAEFRGRLWDALAAEELAGGPRGSFTPHVTLLYDARLVAEQPVDAITWRAKEFALVHSFMRQTRYEVLGRWPFPS